MKICLIRLDKIGDLIATLPVDQIPEIAAHHVSWAIAEGLAFIPVNAATPRRFTEIPLHDPAAGEMRLVEFLRQEQPDLAVIFHAPWWASKALWRSGVQRRFGRRSWWHTNVFLNEGLWQSRSKGARHEADYNLGLLLAALKVPKDIVSAERAAPQLRLAAPKMPELLAQFSLVESNYFVVHAGMGGSAMNWPIASYLALIETLKSEKPVTLTGTANDEAWLAPLKQRFANDPDVRILQNKLTTTELLAILGHAAGVVAPSTGVVHLAASLGVPTVGIYSSLATQHPRRWAPRGPRAGFVVGPVARDEQELSISMGHISPAVVAARLRELAEHDEA
jgi:heptosyltransferase I